MKNLLTLSLLSFLTVSLWSAVPTDDEVISLVDQTATDVEQNAPDTFMKIFRSQEPYLNKENREIYVYVLRPDGKIEVHPHVGPTRTYVKDRTDAEGKKYFENIINRSKSEPDTPGWESYKLKYPDGTFLERKIYYKTITASDGKQYIICSEKKVEQPGE